MGNAHHTTNRATLVSYLATIPDPRSQRGRRYEWLFLLTLIAAAMMSGESTLVGISQWLRAHQDELLIYLPTPRKTLPSLATVRRVLCVIDLWALERAIGAYLQGLRVAVGESGQVMTLTDERLSGQAVDGKTVRCATAHQAGSGKVTHLVSVVGHEHGLVWAQEQAATKLGERPVAETLLAQLPLHNTVTTFDALHTSVKQAKQVRERSGHYLFIVKRNRRTLYEEIDDAFCVLPPQGTCEVEFWQYQSWQIHERGHGRTVDYTLESTPALNDYLLFPDVAQVVRRTRSVYEHRSRQQCVHTEYLVTSLPRHLVTLEHLAQLRRWHWTIENVTHYPRDVSFGEDRCHVHTGSAPQALAAFRNAIAGTLHVEGWPYLPNGFRYCQHHLQTSLRWIGALAT
jgi:predicted transposase YbfD/YdcC